MTQDHQETPRTAALTAKQEALFREGLRTAPSLNVADTLPRSGLEATTAQWADRCRQLLATLDRDRAEAAARQVARVADLEAALHLAVETISWTWGFVADEAGARETWDRGTRTVLDGFAALLSAGDKAEAPRHE